VKHQRATRHVEQRRARRWNEMTFLRIVISLYFIVGA